MRNSIISTLAGLMLVAVTVPILHAADDSDAPQPFRDLATIREIAAGFDKMKPQEVVDRLKPLSVSSLVTAYEAAMDAAKREGIARRAEGRQRP